jgi:hypothetical protein
MRDYRIAYDAKGDDISKALVVLHVPFAALTLLLMFWRQRHYYAEHFVFALHYLAFWMIALQVVAQSINLFHGLPAAWAPPLAFYDWVMRALLVDLCSSGAPARVLGGLACGDRRGGWSDRVNGHGQSLFLSRRAVRHHVCVDLMSTARFRISSP